MVIPGCTWDMSGESREYVGSSCPNPEGCPDSDMIIVETAILASRPSYTFPTAETAKFHPQKPGGLAQGSGGATNPSKQPWNQSSREVCGIQVVGND